MDGLKPRHRDAIIAHIAANERAVLLGLGRRERILLYQMEISRCLAPSSR